MGKDIWLVPIYVIAAAVVALIDMLVWRPW